MIKEQIGNVTLYVQEDSNVQADADAQQLLEIVQQYPESDYHRQIIERANWCAMYQLAELRANLIEWLEFGPHAKILELGAGCGSITSALLKKGASVDAQEANVHYCRANALRNQKAESLSVYAAPLDECEPLLDWDYDVVVAVGVLAHEKDSDKFLQCLRRHLKPEGMLVLATENKFGLKYWAGNKVEHTSRYFAGLENMASRDGIRVYSKKGLETLLAAAGFADCQFYYPYPDYRFTLQIYSDKYLPQKGDLNYNITNYEDDRILLFDEQKVFDSIIEEGQFPFFSNSYLCIAGATEQARQEILYTRYACDRGRALAVRTDIAALSGSALMPAGAVVRKHALYPEGQAHIAHIAEAYTRLSKQYEAVGLRFNRCQPHGPYVLFEFIHAKTLQEQVRQAFAGNEISKIFDILQKLVHYIKNGQKRVKFTMTDDFKRVFGDVSMPDFFLAADCGEVSDIDLILPNILVDAQGIWHVIDYEWTFFFPVPENFIIYRTLFFLHNENPECPEMEMDNLLAATGITPEEAATYAQMEEGFQRYVTGGEVPYREMVNLMERKFLDVVQLKADYDRVAGQNEMLKGRGFWKMARAVKRKLTGSHTP